MAATADIAKKQACAGIHGYHGPAQTPSETEYLKGFREGFIAARDLLMPMVPKITPSCWEYDKALFDYESAKRQGNMKVSYGTEQLVQGGH